MIWAVKTIPGWLSTKRDALRGSPSSSKYWRARLAEAISQLTTTIDGDEREELRSRITEARITVEAHEAKRRVGIGGATSLWMLVGILGIAASLTWAGAVAFSSLVTGVIAITLGLLMIVAEVLALDASSRGTERLYALMAAGRYGHSDIVRSDPWLVLRAYDYWRSAAAHRTLARTRSSEDRQYANRWIRVERSILGIAPRQSMTEVDSDIWVDVQDPAWPKGFCQPYRRPADVLPVTEKLPGAEDKKVDK